VIILIILGEVDFDPNILLSNLSSDTLNLCSSLRVRERERKTIFY
jgi:hypothetical protein